MDIDNKQLEREIENAIRARGLKEQMLQWDKEAKGERLKAMRLGSRRLPHGEKFAEQSIRSLLWQQ